MASMIIVRGLPGSGKSTFAQETLEKSPELVWVEADQFFTDSNGVYVFAPAKIKEAHTWCQDHILGARTRYGQRY
jgi:uridine kinase